MLLIRINYLCSMVYLHEDSEPPIVHQHIKSSNILLDHQWNPKVSDFGITKLLGPEWSLSLSPAMGMSGLVFKLLFFLITIILYFH